MFLKNFIITGEIKCETGLHIGGSNDNINIGGSDNVIIRDPTTNLPYIPGSSLKGKLRYLFELNDKKSVISIVSDKNNGKPSSDIDSISVKIFGTSAENYQEDVNKLKFPTRLIVRDSYPTEETIKNWEEYEDVIDGAELKYENTINRITSKAMPRNIERIPKDSTFNFEMVYSIYKDDKNNLSSLFEAMRLLEDNYLGGSGSRGFGKVKFNKITITKRSNEYYKNNAKEEPIVENSNLIDIYKEDKFNELIKNKS